VGREAAALTSRRGAKASEAGSRVHSVPSPSARPVSGRPPGAGVLLAVFKDATRTYLSSAGHFGCQARFMSRGGGDFQNFLRKTYDELKKKL